MSALPFQYLLVRSTLIEAVCLEQSSRRHPSFHELCLRECFHRHGFHVSPCLSLARHPYPTHVSVRSAAETGHCQLCLRSHHNSRCQSRCGFSLCLCLLSLSATHCQGFIYAFSVFSEVIVTISCLLSVSTQCLLSLSVACCQYVFSYCSLSVSNPMLTVTV